MRIAFSTFCILLATPAFAHSGGHLHPHGAGNWLAVVLAALVVGGTMTFAYLRGRK